MNKPSTAAKDLIHRLIEKRVERSATSTDYIPIATKPCHTRGLRSTDQANLQRVGYELAGGDSDEGCEGGFRLHLPRRRLRPSQVKVRSMTQRRGTRMMR